VAEVIEPALLAVALPGRVHQGQVARMPDAVGSSLAPAFEKAVFQGNRDVLGETDADETAGGDRVASRIRRTAARAETTLPVSEARSAEAMGWLSRGMTFLQVVVVSAVCTQQTLSCNLAVQVAPTLHEAPRIGQREAARAGSGKALRDTRKPALRPPCSVPGGD
jgi:hypothetical protein